MGIEISGIKEMNKILDSLDDKSQIGIYRKAIRKSIMPMIKKGKARYASASHPYSKGTSTPADSIKPIMLKKGGAIGYRAKPSGKGSFLAKVLDAGTVNRKGRGMIKGSKFWSGAIDQGIGEAKRSLSSNVQKVLQAQINRSVKRYGLRK